MRFGNQLGGKVIFVAACIMAGAFVSASCQQDIADPKRPPATDGAEARVIETLPDFTLADVNGDKRAISEWSGQALLINFWATWCAPCRREMPLLQTLHQESGRHGLQVVGIAIDRQPDVLAFITETGINYPILVGQEDAYAVTELFGLDFLGLPFSVLVSAGGQILKLHIGELHPEDLQAMLDAARELSAGSLTVAEARERLQAS